MYIMDMEQMFKDFKHFSTEKAEERKQRDYIVPSICGTTLFAMTCTFTHSLSLSHSLFTFYF